MEFYKSWHSGKKSKSQRQNDTPSRSFRNSRNDRHPRDGSGESADIVCAGCGTKCEIPFVPRTGRPVYCRDCFRKNRPQDSRDGKIPRSDLRSPGRESRRDSTPQKPRDKSMKKQAGYYSDGSDKFYATIKEKLYGILGGKTCSGCGFQDERALGITNMNDGESSESLRRGGNASSWGRYISDPDLARQELAVLCLNCSVIRQPAPRPADDTRPDRKKTRRFPR